MNVLFISSQFPNVCEPNKGIFSMQMVRELAEYANVQVVAPIPALGPLKVVDSFKRYRTDYDIPEREVRENIVVHHPKYFAMPKMGFLHHVFLYFSLLPLIKAIHESWHIDAINCHWVFPDGVAVQKVCEKMGIPLLLTPLGTDLNRYSDFRLRRESIRNALVKADMVSVLCSPMYDRCLSMGVSPRKLQIIPNGVDLQKFSLRDKAKCRTQLKISENVRVILFVGSLVPVKGIDTLLKAFAIIREKHTKGTLKLYVVGSGFLEQDLKRLADDVGIGADTVFVGAVEHSNLPIWMNSADCLCLPSLSEGHPNVVMEALACGLPVVASAVGSVPDYVTMQTGFTITPADHDDLAEKLDKCLRSEYEREQIRSSVKDLSWRDCAERYHNAISSMRVTYTSTSESK